MKPRTLLSLLVVGSIVVFAGLRLGAAGSDQG